MTVSLLGAQTKIPVRIYECPFVDVTVNSAPTRQYIFGDENYGEIYDADDSEYYLYPFDISGLSFTVEYKDGTTRTFDDDDFDLGYLEIDDYPFEVDYIVCDAVGTYEVTLQYKGYNINYDIEVIDKPEYTLGDVDFKDGVTVLDATAIQMHLVKSSPLEGESLLVADTNRDGEVTVLDATTIQLYVAKKITEF